MNLGILLPLGESLKNYAKYGQDIRFVKYYLNKYANNFDQVFVFSYDTEQYLGLPKNCDLICPKVKFQRYLYGILLPFICFNEYLKCDVFRCFHPSAAIPAIIGKLFFGKKFIFNYNYDYLEWARVENKSSLVPLLFFQQWLAFKFCDGVFVADEQMKEYAKKFVSETKITIIRNGVDISSFKPLPKINDNKEKIILSVGRLETQKNYEQLIEAISRLKVKIKLIIVGRGTLKEKLIKYARKLGVKLQIIDVVPNDELPEIYNSADVYVQPSLIEAPVKTLLEAMSCGRPCVATDVVGIRDIITDGQNGYLSQLNAVSLADKITKVLKNKEKSNAMGVRARELMKQKYNLLKILDIEVKILSNI